MSMSARYIEALFTSKSIARRCSIPFVISRNRTPSEYVSYGLYLYFSGLSLRMASKRLAFLVKRNHVSIWNWIQKVQTSKGFNKEKKDFRICYR